MGKIQIDKQSDTLFHQEKLEIALTLMPIEKHHRYDEDRY